MADPSTGLAVAVGVAVQPPSATSGGSWSPVLATTAVASKTWMLPGPTVSGRTPGRSSVVARGAPMSISGLVSAGKPSCPLMKSS